MIKILCPEPNSFSATGLELASRYSQILALDMDQSTFEAAANDFDVLLIRLNTRVHASLLQRAPRVRTIISPTTGLDHINMEEADRLGVKVYHLRGQKQFLNKVSSTAELTVALILSALRKLPQAFEQTRLGCWDQGSLRGHEAAEKLIGIVGCGRLGTKVARVCSALGMRVLAYDPFIARLPRGVSRANSLHELLVVSDIVSLHLPLMPETYHLLGKREFSTMKQGSILVNTSRGAILDSFALVEALQSGRLASAAVDVIEDEEGLLRGDKNLLIEYARVNTNLLVTPHIGGATQEAVEKTDNFILNRFLKDEGLIK